MEKVYILQTAKSDHLPLFVFFRTTIQRYVAKRFCYENSYALESYCKHIVEMGWKVREMMTLE